ncbi:MAG: hypothetical protein OES78_14330, partial [Chromatiales bacterium]|nr:hypothetical protein [Chromatiales bacterium]
MYRAANTKTDKGMPLRSIIVAALAALLSAPWAWADDTDPDALADKMLERLGGRAAWAGLRNTINGSQQNR